MTKAGSYYYIDSSVFGWLTNNISLDTTRPYEGSYYLPLGGWILNSGNYVSQIITPQANQNYQLSFYGNSFFNSGSLVVELIDITTGIPVLYETIIDLTPSSGYELYTYYFTAPSNQLLLRFTDTSDSINGTANNDFDIDNISVRRTGIIPPATGDNDTIITSVTYTIASNVNVLSLAGSGNINAFGQAGDDTLLGNSGNNTLYGGAGADSLAGGIGDDLYIVDNANDMVTEADTNLIRNGNFENSNGTEFWTITKTGNAQLFGNSYQFDGRRSYFMNTGIHTLSQEVQTQAGQLYTLRFAAGTGEAHSVNIAVSDETGVYYTTSFNLTPQTGPRSYLPYTFNFTGSGRLTTLLFTFNVGVANLAVDAFTLVAANTDRVESSVSYTLGDFIEQLVLTGLDPISGFGGLGVNTIWGNAGNNTLGGGQDFDTLIGGLGDDTYYVNAYEDVDAVIELVGEGNDTVMSAYLNIAYTLPDNVENLFLLDIPSFVAPRSGFGNALDNSIRGSKDVNTLDGFAGADTLAGGQNNDTYIVENTGDVVIENAGEGTDTILSSITYTLSENVETLSLSGTANINAFGTAVVDTLRGNTGDNTLDGGIGADSLAGGTGNDTYIVDNAGDNITEAPTSGTDTIIASISYTLRANTEVLSLSGSAHIHATGTTTSFETLIGNSGDNTLNGMAGTDTMIGGVGNDTYFVDIASDVITEAGGEGFDTVHSTVSYTLAANAEVLHLSTITAALLAVGNNLDNTLTGNGQGNTLDGAAGADSMAGATGSDIYIVDNANDVVTENSGEGIDTIQSSISFTLAANTETLSLTGSANINATGTTMADTLRGNTGVNTLDGGAGADSLAGGTGDDTYIVDNAADIVTEAAASGTDTIIASISYTLSTNTEVLSLSGSANINATGTTTVNTLTGNAGDNTLDGLAGADTMIGGVGNDTYLVDNTGDVVTENTGEGTDTIQSSITLTLGAQVEVLTLTGLSAIHGTANTLDNVLTGNNAANSLSGLSGNDTLDGRVGADTLIGGLGDDLFIVDNASEVITEGLGEGQDTIRTGITFTLSTNIEVLSLTGSSNINGIGNALNNTLTGNIGNNTLNGQAGADTMLGGAGNDLYMVDNSADVIVEDTNEGTDTIEISAAISYTLGTNIEVVTLSGSSAINVIGNTSDNTITGNAGANTLSGGEGADWITGGSGNDTFIVNGIGEGVDWIHENGLVTDSDTLQIGSLGGLARNDIVIFQNGNNLELAFIGTSTVSNRLTLENHFAPGNTSRIETITFTGDNYFLTHTAITSIINNMATYAAANSVALTDIDVVKGNANLLAIVNAGWTN